MEELVINLRNQKRSMNYIAKELKCSSSKVHKICVDNGINKIGLTRSKGFKMSDEAKKKMSESKKSLYKNNPEKHNWKLQSKLISKPCEEFKRILNKNNIHHIDEFTPLNDRFFSIDIILPNKMVGIEINGNQHYNKDGTLKDYYKKRHDMIEKSGWKLYEIHFSICYNEEEILSIIDNINNNHPDIFSFNYNEYLISKLNIDKSKYICDICGGDKKCQYSKQCSECQHFVQRKVERPKIDQLIKDIKDLGYRGTGRKYKVSDTSIRKWLKGVTLM